MVALEDLNSKKDVTVLGMVSLHIYWKTVQTCDISRSCGGIKVQRRQKYIGMRVTRIYGSCRYTEVRRNWQRGVSNGRDTIYN